MIVRLWKQEDIATISELEKNCFSDPWTEEMLKSVISPPFSHGFLLEENGEIVAYGCLATVFEDAEVQNIAVAPKYRKRGLGRLLLNEMEAFAKKAGATKCFLEVRENNFNALGLYLNSGYRQISVRKRYYADGENALVMEKEL
ncbi:MAG: ribosomal protein S18-alanine N-acetyltransferase [Clostridia bacterium]|nr:ribosomal protein S18-alanine N-acetyltransferase [Clostridia bacterium]